MSEIKDSSELKSESVSRAFFEAQKIERRIAQYPDMRAENLWGEFMAQFSDLAPGLPDYPVRLERMAHEFLDILTEPKTRETPCAILAAELILKHAQ